MPTPSRLRTRSRRSLLLPGACLALALIASGCGDSSSSNGVTLTLYNGQHVPEASQLVTAFEQKTGIDVQMRSNEEDTLADTIVEVERAHPKADLFLSENSPSLEYLEGKGMLAQVDASTLAAVPSTYSSAEGRWLGVSAQASVIVYNPKLIAPARLPRRILDFATDAYRGKMAFAPSDVDFQPIVTSVVAAYGRQKTVAWLQAMKSTAGDHAYPDDEAVESAVNQGRVAFGVINEYYWLRFHGDAAAKNARIVTFAAHDPGYVLFVAGAAALASSKHPREAQQFLAFLTTPEAQKIVATAGIEYPLAQPTLGTGPLGRPFTSLAPNPIDVDRLGDGSLAIALLRQAGLI